MLNTRVFILGAGFIGKPLARQLKDNGHSVEVSVRNIENTSDLRCNGIPIHVFSVGDVLDHLEIFSFDTLVLCYPIGSRSQPAGSHLIQVEWLANYFPNNKLKQVILTSSTSVYPDGFGLVNEDFSIRPKDHGLIQLEYEEALQGIYGDKLTVFRLAGLIGEHRQPGRFLAGKTDLPNGQSPVNMVHQVDVIRFITAAIDRRITGKLFNLCHDKHPTRATFYTALASSLGLLPPTFSSEQIQEPKVVDNTKSKLFFDLDYAAPID